MPLWRMFAYQYVLAAVEEELVGDSSFGCVMVDAARPMKRRRARMVGMRSKKPGKN